MSGSLIADITDYTAQRAATIPGISAVAAMGYETYTDLLRPTETIDAATEWPAEPFTHQTLEPSAPVVDYITQEGDVQITWTVPMRLWLNKAPVDQVRRVALPFYNLYLACFVPDPRLGGLCVWSFISRFNLANAPRADWAWLEVDLSVTEQIRY
jgi:hypothetical protein